MRFKERFVSFVLVAACWISQATSVAGQAIPAPPLPQLCAACIRSNLDYLAGPVLHGRGSGTIDEYHAAQFIARKLERYGLAPAADGGTYIQAATVHSPKKIGRASCRERV